MRCIFYVVQVYERVVDCQDVTLNLSIIRREGRVGGVSRFWPPLHTVEVLNSCLYIPELALERAITLSRVWWLSVAGRGECSLR